MQIRGRPVPWAEATLCPGLQLGKRSLGSCACSQASSPHNVAWHPYIECYLHGGEEYSKVREAGGKGEGVLQFLKSPEENE